ncbi:MAG: hypothetical protein R2786_10690 [Flavobacteriaceae bacterium]
MKILNDWRILILLCLTLGLAPYAPEPHLWGKLKWVAGGAVGMKPQDYFDVLLHGAPFILLIRRVFVEFLKKNEK